MSARHEEMTVEAQQQAAMAAGTAVEVKAWRGGFRRGLVELQPLPQVTLVDCDSGS